MRLTVHLDNDDDQQRKWWISALVWLAVILFEVGLIMTSLLYVVLALKAPD